MLPQVEGDNLYSWDLAFPSATFLESAPGLFQDLLAFGDKFQLPDEVQLKLHFPKNYPQVGALRSLEHPSLKHLPT